jgi:hypothetical protein
MSSKCTRICPKIIKMCLANGKFIKFSNQWIRQAYARVWDSMHSKHRQIDHCIITLIRSSTEALEAATSRPTNTIIRGIKSGVRSEINYLRVNFTLTRAVKVFLMSHEYLTYLTNKEDSSPAVCRPSPTTICKNLIHFPRWKGQSATIQMEVQMLSISRLSMMIAFGLLSLDGIGSSAF